MKIKTKIKTTKTITGGAVIQGKCTKKKKCWACRDKPKIHIQLSLSQGLLARKMPCRAENCFRRWGSSNQTKLVTKMITSLSSSLFSSQKNAMPRRKLLSVSLWNGDWWWMKVRMKSYIEWVLQLNQARLGAGLFIIRAGLDLSSSMKKVC